MASKAFDALSRAVSEIKDLEKANPTPFGKAPKQPEVTRAIGRASIVLLCSHFERYFRDVNEEVVVYINNIKIRGDLLPEELRLLHTQGVVEELAETQWNNRAEKLKSFAETESWLWLNQHFGSIDHPRLLSWMKSPKPDSLVRYYKYWEIKDIFYVITRKPKNPSEKSERSRIS
jgi:RiboL-PSP-HEPN